MISLFKPVRCHIENATIHAPVMIRYFGCTMPINLPTIGIIISVNIPPGDSANPASIAVYPSSVCSSCGNSCVVEISTAPVPSITRKQAPNWRRPQQADVDDRILSGQFPRNQREQAERRGEREAQDHVRSEPVVALAFVKDEFERTQPDRDQHEADIVDAQSIAAGASAAPPRRRKAR